MLKDIEVKGFFFTPQTPDEHIAGILKFNKSEGIELDLFGHFNRFRYPSSTDNNIILGFTSEGKKVTLLNCYESSSRMTFPGFPQSKYTILYLFVGEHFTSIDEINFDSCLVEYEGLNYWLDISGFEKPVYDRDNSRFLIEYNTPNKINFELTQDWIAEISFDFYAPLEFFIPIDRVELTQKSIIKFIPKLRSTFKQFENVISLFSSFLAIN